MACWEKSLMRILIAEDDSASRRVLETVLGRWGYEVTAVADGLQAWQSLCVEDAPRLAILDWMMPEMDGAEVCRRIRQSSPSSPAYIILLTAKGRREDLVLGLEAGADDYITKPFDPEELRARIQVGERVVELQTALAARVEELEDALAQVKTLQGIIPICVHCHKIRDDQNYWQRLESYICEHSDAQFSHGLCPDCLKELYPEFCDGDDEAVEPPLEATRAAPRERRPEEH